MSLIIRSLLAVALLFPVTHAAQCDMCSLTGSPLVPDMIVDLGEEEIDDGGPVTCGAFDEYLKTLDSESFECVISAVLATVFCCPPPCVSNLLEASMCVEEKCEECEEEGDRLRRLQPRRLEDYYQYGGDDVDFEIEIDDIDICDLEGEDEIKACCPVCSSEIDSFLSCAADECGGGGSSSKSKASKSKSGKSSKNTKSLKTFNKSAKGENSASGIVNGEECSNVVVVSNLCVSGSPHFDSEGDVCANENQPNEAYCSYGIGQDACAYCAESEINAGGYYYAKSNKSEKSAGGYYYAKSAKSEKSAGGYYYAKSAKSEKSAGGYYSAKSAKIDKS